MSVRLTDIVKCFGHDAAVDGVSVEIPDGTFFVVLGPSGCGKTTLLRLIAGLDVPDRGSVTLDGAVVSGVNLYVPPEDRQVGFVFQSYALWPHMNVRENVGFPIEARGASRADALREADLHLRTVALETYQDRAPAELSGGQRQRVALARCLAGGTKTILMDEPLANLDPHLRASMEEELSSFHRRTGATTIYITHDQREAMALADQVAVMFEGRFAQVGTPVEVYERPVTETVARFIGRSAIVDSVLRRHGGAWRADLGPLNVAASVDKGAREGVARAVIRPGDITLDGENQDRAILGRVAACSYRGGVWEGRIDAIDLAEPLPVTSSHPLQPGEIVGLTIKTCWVLPSH